MNESVLHIGFVRATLLVLFALSMCAEASRSPKHSEQLNASGTPMVRTAAVVAPPVPTVTISWSFPTNQQTPDLKFRLRSSTNLTIKLSLWPVVTNIPGTNRAVKWPMLKQNEFFTLTASNSFGESGYATKWLPLTP